MGSLLSRTKPTTIEILEKLDVEIEDLEDRQRYTNLRQKHCVGYLLFGSVVAYIACALLGYIYFYPETHLDLMLRILPLLAFPLFIWILKLAVTWIFCTQLENNERTLNDLRKKRRKILDEVMDTETYKVAKEILERFDPDAKRERSMQMFQRSPLRQTFGGTPSTGHYSGQRFGSRPTPMAAGSQGLRQRRQPTMPLPQQPSEAAFASHPPTPAVNTPVVVGRSAGQRAVVHLQPPTAVVAARDVPPDPDQTSLPEQNVNEPGGVGPGSSLSISTASTASVGSGVTNQLRRGQPSPPNARSVQVPARADYTGPPYPVSIGSAMDRPLDGAAKMPSVPYSTRPVRPILPKERSTVDKMVDYFLGDGPNNRLALICSQCKSHNGMAMAEEFPFIAYRCCYCAHFNPARRQRPQAPGLNDPPIGFQNRGYKNFGSEFDLSHRAVGSGGRAESTLSLNELSSSTPHHLSDNIRTTQINLARRRPLSVSETEGGDEDADDTDEASQVGEDNFDKGAGPLSEMSDLFAEGSTTDKGRSDVGCRNSGSGPPMGKIGTVDDGGMFDEVEQVGEDQRNVIIDSSASVLVASNAAANLHKVHNNDMGLESLPGDRVPDFTDLDGCKTADSPRCVPDHQTGPVDSSVSPPGSAKGSSV